jgi:hypothetical protein
MRVSHTASAVNFGQVTGNVTGSRPIISAQGSDSNIGLNLASKGNRAITLLTNAVTAFDVLSPASGVNYLTANGSITGIAPSLVASGTDTNIDLDLVPKGTGTVVAEGPFTATGQTSLGGAAGAETARVNTGTNTGKYTLFESNTASNLQLIGAVGTANLGLYSTGGGAIRFNTAAANQELQFLVARTASAVNYVQVTGAATGGAVNVTAQGSDTNVRANFYSKGTSNVVLGNGAGINFIAGANAGTSANYLTAASNSAGSAPYLAATGSDTNINLTLTPREQELL